MAREVPSTSWTPTGPSVPMSEVLRRADDFFQRRSPVHLAALALTERLGRLGIPFGIAGGFALGSHRHERVTDDLDIVVRGDDWRRFKDAFLGLGYRERFAGSKGVIDVEHGVRIDALLTGGFPGDGQPKPVTFPDPASPGVVLSTGPYPVVTLETLVQLKLACGMTAPGRRLQDYADVVRLIRANALPEAFAGRLDPYVREEFLRLHHDATLPDDLPE